MNIRELDEESRRTGVWPPRRIILRVDGGSSATDAAESEAPVSVGLVDLTSAPRPTVRTAPRTAARAIAPEALALGQVAPRPPLSRPPAAGSVMRRHGRIVTPPRAASKIAEQDAEFERWLAMPLAISESGPDYQETPVWLPEDRRVRAERRHRRIARRTRTQLLGTGAATALAAVGCSAALALVLSQTETVGGSLGVPSIGLFGTRPAPSAPAAAAPVVRRPAAKKAKKVAKTKKATKKKSTSRRAKAPAAPSATPNVASGNSTPARTPASTPSRRVVTPPPPPPPAATQPAPVKKSTPPPKKATTPQPVQTPPSGSTSPLLGGGGEPSLGPG